MKIVALIFFLVSVPVLADSITSSLERIDQTDKTISKYGFCIEIKETVYERGNKGNLPFYIVAISYPARIGDAEFESSFIYYGNQFDYLNNFRYQSKLAEPRGSLEFALVLDSFKKTNIELTYWGNKNTAVYTFELNRFLESSRQNEYPNLTNINTNCIKKNGF